MVNRVNASLNRINAIHRQRTNRGVRQFLSARLPAEVVGRIGRYSGNYSWIPRAAGVRGRRVSRVSRVRVNRGRR